MNDCRRLKCFFEGAVYICNVCIWGAGCPDVVERSRASVPRSDERKGEERTTVYQVTSIIGLRPMLIF